VRLCADLIGGGSAVALRVSVSGDAANATSLGAITPADCTEAVLRLLEVIARRGRDARARDVLVAEGNAALRDSIGKLLFNSARPRFRGDPRLDSRLRGNQREMAIGLHLLRSTLYARGIGLAFGHADATTLERLADAAEAAAVHGTRIAPGRALLAIGLTRESATNFAAAAERLGFIVRADDPRRRVIACAGAPICASALMESRAMAPRLAEIAAPFDIHVSGCAKGCAHPGPAAVTIVGTPEGCALIGNGTARDAPFAVVAAADAPAATTRYAEVGHV
jgi:precorrin-3B synthase